ncbi:MAG: hypothetical protein GY847_28835 [Proteobacteria bacterium]|nr:hypothetical protein [Pseudomonadota bacterium]
MTTAVKLNMRVNPYYTYVTSLDSELYRLTIKWNVTVEKWIMDIYGLNTDSDVDIKGMALLCGKDLLDKHGFIQLGELWVIDNTGANEDPNYLEMGTRFSVEYTPLA